MGYKKTKVINCKTASIRKKPWATQSFEETIGEIKCGDYIDIDPNECCFDWVDNKFYKTKNPDGWINAGLVSYGKEEE